jgi:hypothetical protein
MWKHAFSALALALAVGACSAPALAAAIGGVGDVSVLSTRIVPVAAGGPGFPANGGKYVLAKVALRNGSTRDFIPAISRFFLTSDQGERFQGTDSGSSVFVGVSNSHRLLKAGDTRDYTVGFRTPDPIVNGTISYEP